MDAWCGCRWGIDIVIKIDLTVSRGQEFRSSVIRSFWREVSQEVVAKLLAVAVVI